MHLKEMAEARSGIFEVQKDPGMEHRHLHEQRNGKTISFHAKKDFLDHVNRRFNHQGQFEVILVEEARPDKTCKILLVKEVNRTYFTGPVWIELVKNFGMDTGMRLRIYLDKTCGVISFSYEILDSESSDFEDHSLGRTSVLNLKTIPLARTC